MLPALDRNLSRLRRRACVEVLADELSLHLAWALLAAGALVFVGRFLLGWPAESAAQGLWILAIVPFSAWWRAQPRFLSRAGAVAWLDVRCGATGAVLTAYEVDDERWIERARELMAAAPPTPPVRPLPRLARLLPGLLFLAGAFWFEPPRPEPGPPARVAEAALERLREKLETLEETLDLEPQLAQELRARLERIEQDLDEARAESTFEALDRLEESLEAQAQRAQEEALEAGEQLARVERDPGAMDASSEFESALAKMIEQGLLSGLAEELPEGLLGKLDPSTLSLPAGMELDAAELAELSQELRELLAARLAELTEAGLLDSRHLSEFSGQLASLEGFEFHECDEECEKEGGT